MYCYRLGQGFVSCAIVELIVVRDSNHKLVSCVAANHTSTIVVVTTAHATSDIVEMRLDSNIGLLERCARLRAPGILNQYHGISTVSSVVDGIQFPT